MRKKVAFIGTGGTISSVGRGPLEITDYAGAMAKAPETYMLHAEGVLAAVPAVQEVAEVIPVAFRNMASPAIYFDEWKEIAALCQRTVEDIPDLAGIVIGHGTATLEETAYFLSLTLKVAIPVVIVGSQRALNSLSSDAPLNLVSAIRVAASPESRGRGVLVLLNDEIQAAREVTKTSTFRLQAFRSQEYGILGCVDGDAVRYYRRTERRHAPDTEFDVSGLAALPRVDICFSYAGADGAAVRGFVAAGARGIVSAGFAPGSLAPGEAEALVAAAAAGVVVVQSTRAGSGAALDSVQSRERGFLTADNLNPQKARLLLALALSATSDPTEIARVFRDY
ncbi:MAG TPA: asparaginase [Stellaceae bacterium]|nr:asparaginase [Stellaceae bacterium]